MAYEQNLQQVPSRGADENEEVAVVIDDVGEDVELAPALHGSAMASEQNLLEVPSRGSDENEEVSVVDDVGEDVPEAIPAKPSVAKAVGESAVPAVTPATSFAPQELLAEAMDHMRRTACTVLNKSTGKYEFQSVLDTSPSEMGHLGVGVRLYFEFTKQMGWVFFIMTLLTLPSLFFNLTGSMVDDSSPLNNAIGQMSVANLGNCPAAGCRSNAELRERCALRFHLPLIRELADGACDLKVIDITEWLGLLDGIAILIFMIFGVFFAHRLIPRIVRMTDAAQITPSDYTVWIPHLPKYLPEDHARYEQVVTEHFQKILKSGKVKVEDEDAIEDVTLVRDYDGAIMNFKDKGVFLQKIENTRVLHEHACVRGRTKETGKHSKTIAKLEGKVAAIDKSLRHQAQKTDADRGVCSAFVTFKHEEYKEKVLDEYRLAQHGLFRCCQSEKLQFAGHKIKVQEACEPTDLYWENLDYEVWKRRVRKAIVGVLTLIVLFACSGVIASLQSMSQQSPGTISKTTWVVANTATSGSSCLDLCSVEFFTSSNCAGRSSREWATEKIFDNSGTVALGAPHWESSCATRMQGCNNGTSLAWIGVEFNQLHAVGCMEVHQADAAPAGELRAYACRSPPPSGSAPSWDPAERCQPMQVVYPKSSTSSGPLQLNSDASCAMDPASYIAEDVARLAKEENAANPAGDPTVSCFCKQQSKGNLAAFIAPPYSPGAKQLCQEWSQELAKTYGQLVGVTLAVLLLNQVLLVLYSYFIAWERLCTVTEMTRSQLLKLFLSQFVNTGLLMALVNSSIKQYPDALFFLKMFSIGTGNYQDVNSQWFTAVGTTLVLTILMQVFSTTVPPLAMSYIVTPLLARFYSRKKVTQEALNQVYTLPQWNLALRLAQSLNVIFCIAMYSGGMPILYPIGCLYCVVAYWLDKWCLLKGSCRPPAYKEDVLKLSMHMLPMAAFLHTAVAAWTFGNQDLFPSRWSILKPLAESLFISGERYDVVMEGYRTGAVYGVTWDFLMARLLDFSREGAWLLMCIFLCCFVYYVIYYICHFLLGPFLRPVGMLLMECCFSCARGHKLADGGSQVAQSPPFREAKHEMEAKGITSSYRLSDNQFYRDAYRALDFTHKKVTQQSLGLPSISKLPSDFTLAAASGEGPQTPPADGEDEMEEQEAGSPRKQER